MGEDPEGLEAVTTLQALADRVSRGEALRDDDAALVAASHDLITIGTMADDVRRRLHGPRTTFGRVFEMHVDAVPASLPPGVSAGEFRLVGRPASLDAACAAVRQARTLAGDTPLLGFTITDLAELEAPDSGPFTRLRASGLDGVAETPVDAVSGTLVTAARHAGLLVQRVTVHAASPDPIATMAAVRDLQNAVGGFRAFAPLPRTMSVAAPTTGYDDVKLVALARLQVLEIPSIQVDWPLYGPKLAQVALTMGADDVDGIAAVETVALGVRRSAIEEIRGNIRAAGLEAAERDGRFEVTAH